MGEAKNTEVSGAAKIQVLADAGKLEAKYSKDTDYNKLPAVDQLAIDQAYDEVIRLARPSLTNPKI